MAHRAELRRLVSRYGLTHPRVFGSVLSGTDTDESDLDLLVDPSESTASLRLLVSKSSLGSGWASRCLC
jgi:uncharacterized protein